jgi:hypothetical protein
MFTQRSVTIQINQFISVPLTFERGLPQGCILSPILFSLAMAPLLYYIDHHIQGIQYETGAIKMYSYLDDQIYFIDSFRDMTFVVRTIEDFRFIAGVAINTDKSKIMKLGRNITTYHLRIPEVDFLDILGIRWFTSLDKTSVYNIQVVKNRIVRDCIQYKYAFLTVAARARFFNVFVLSKATYVLQLFLLDRRSLAVINKFIGNFIWFQQILRTQRDNLYLPYNVGGVNLKHIQLYNRALLIHRVLRVLCDSQGSFAEIFFFKNSQVNR